MPHSSFPRDDVDAPAWEHWDPVMKTEYLSDLEEPEPGSELVLEIRRGVLHDGRVGVDLRPSP